MGLEEDGGGVEDFRGVVGVEGGEEMTEEPFLLLFFSVFTFVFVFDP